MISPEETNMTIEPVTLSGPYELTDGRVQEFYWVNGQLIDGEIFDSWAERRRILSEREAADPLN